MMPSRHHLRLHSRNGHACDYLARPRHLPVSVSRQHAAARGSPGLRRTLRARPAGIIPSPLDGCAGLARAQRSHRGCRRRRARDERPRWCRTSRSVRGSARKACGTSCRMNKGGTGPDRRRADHHGGRAAQQQLRGSRGRWCTSARRRGSYCAPPGAPTVYFAGDTGAVRRHAPHRQLYRPQLACLPIGDVFTMGPEQAARACEMLGVSQVLPIHHGDLPRC